MEGKGGEGGRDPLCGRHAGILVDHLFGQEWAQCLGISVDHPVAELLHDFLRRHSAPLPDQVDRPTLSSLMYKLLPVSEMSAHGALRALIRQPHLKRVANGIARKGKRNTED